MLLKKFYALAALAVASLTASAAMPVDTVTLEADTIILAPDSLSVSFPVDTITFPADTFTFVTEELPVVVFLPAVYTGYDMSLPTLVRRMPPEYDPATDTIPEWLARVADTRRFANALMQHHAINAPWQVPYNIRTMASPPKKYVATADPQTAATIFREVGAMPGPVVAEKPKELATSEVVKRHWLNRFTSLLQFSQGFVSPNWYQGGNNSLNLLADFTYQTNLNEKFHPKVLFENFFQWRTALTSTPDDPYRPVGLTENRFQINTKFGYRALHNWYYSFTAMLKTPILHGYKGGTETRTASLFSPGELNVGVGMTFNGKALKDKFTISLSVSPLSYNLKTCIDPKIDETGFGIEEGRKTFNALGSSLEANWEWKMAHNISWRSRVFAFTDYKRFQADWQNQIAFNINQWFSANLTVDLRYDSSVEATTAWKQIQLRELLSLGFSYKFSTPGRK